MFGVGLVVGATVGVLFTLAGLLDYPVLFDYSKFKLVTDKEEETNRWQR